MKILLLLALFQTNPDIQRLEQMHQAAPDHGGVWIEMATAQAKAGNKAEALKWLDKAVSRGLDFDLPDDPAFEQLRARAAANRKVVSRGKVAFRIPEKDLIPEGIAHDPETGAFFVGSLHKKKIVRIDKSGKASDFAAAGQDGLRDVLGMKVDPKARSLWACSASALFQYDLKTGKLVKRYEIAGEPHLCNDIALGQNGELFVTDSTGRAVHRLKGGKLEPFVGPGTFIYPNGIAISPDFKKLFVADFLKGLSVVDVATGQARALPHPEKVHVAGLDGLYFHKGSLVAVQNSAGIQRIVRFRLNAALDAIESEEILESRNPSFDIPTTGVLVDGKIAVIANSLLDRLDDKGGLKPDARLAEVVILEIPVE